MLSRYCILVFALFLLSPVLAQGPMGRSLPVIPKPVSVQLAGGHYALARLTAMVIPSGNPEAERMATLYASELGLAGLKTIQSKEIRHPRTSSITLSLVKGESRDGFYKINISKNGIWVQASQPRGWFYALQTLEQLLGLDARNAKDRILPYGLIEDAPRFAYRGMHLDVSRHFYPVETIKQYIAMMARFKFNSFHWHLTDDQGWRIEILKFPELTARGAVRKATRIGHAGSYPERYDSAEYRGHYTQDEIREIVRFAADHYVEVIPEIDVPGHSLAALAAYPEFSCSGAPREVATTWGTFAEGVFCTRDTALWFVKEVLSEVCELFPGKYIHIGGDEVITDAWKSCAHCQAVMRRNQLGSESALQRYFVREIERHLRSKGKSMVGWDETVDVGAPRSSTIMSWRGMEGGIAAARQQLPVIMCPSTHCYFDHYQSASPHEPLAIGGYTPLEKTYSFDPIPSALKPNERSLVIGVQGNVWSEYLPKAAQVLYMAYPRAVALSEVAWSSPEQRDYSDFLGRLQQHIAWFRQNGTDISSNMAELDYRTAVAEDGRIGLYFVRPPVEGKILLESTRDGDVISQYLTQDSFILDRSIDFRVWYQLAEGYIGKPLSMKFKKHLAAGARIRLDQAPSPRYFSGGAQCLINGITANPQRHGSSEWVGMEGVDFKAVIDLGQVRNISSLAIQFLHDPGSWIHRPTEIVVRTSADGEVFGEGRRQMVSQTLDRHVQTEISVGDESVRYLEIRAINHGEIAKGLPGAGNHAWLFVGELEVW
ncbi:MAG: beta-N-acetylhexosaminidase [Saprospiraceae bacterium]|nr:beta-N-acetylhexosaminidase [Saprospiraceae bacterium]MBP9209575.1 beta-N-acetylhexosaminidase [Saprospiraceae bacterium]